LLDNLKELPQRETIGKVQVYRVWSSRFGRSHLLSRAIDSLTFIFTCGWALLGLVRRGDTVVFMTDPPLLQLINSALVRLKGGWVINWMQDIYPELAFRLGRLPGSMNSMLSFWRDRNLRKARDNVVVSEVMARYLNQRKVSHLSVIPNWADESAITPVDRSSNHLRRDWGLEGRFVVMYSGNFGRAHAFPEIAQVAIRLKDHPLIRFLLVGEGAALPALRKSLVDAGCKNVIYKHFQRRELLPLSLAVADMHLVSLKPGMEQLLMPSKLVSALAVGRPVGFIGESGSAIASEITGRQAGFATTSGDIQLLEERILELAQDPGRCAELGNNARAWFLEQFSRREAMASWERLLQCEQGVEHRQNCGASNKSAAKV
jgi:colanic acid biosynthesis glycosyl transferase WcaI